MMTIIIIHDHIKYAVDDATITKCLLETFYLLEKKYSNFAFLQVAHDHICYRYEILEVIGKGSFGQVIRALDHRTNQHVAIKIIRNKKRFHHQALIEVRILDHLRTKDKDSAHNVIHMLDFFYFRNHLCISFELMR